MSGVRSEGIYVMRAILALTILIVCSLGASAQGTIKFDSGWLVTSIPRLASARHENKYATLVKLTVGTHSFGYRTIGAQIRNKTKKSIRFTLMMYAMGKDNEIKFTLSQSERILGGEEKNVIEIAYVSFALKGDEKIFYRLAGNNE